MYADAGAVLEMRASSYERVTSVPIVLVVAEVNIGARKSGATAELLVTAKFDADNMSLPVGSCSAAFPFEGSSVGAL